MELAVFDFLFSSDDDSSSSSDSEEYFCPSIEDDSSISSDSEENLQDQDDKTAEDFVEVIHGYNESVFKTNFRLLRSTAQILIDRYSSTERFEIIVQGGRPKIAAEKEIFVFLWYMANTDTFRELANKFSFSTSTAWNVVKRVMKWLLSIAHEFVKWPSASEAEIISEQFEDKCKIPGVVGAIDVTHIRIKTPTDGRERYLNSKRQCSISLQAVVDVNQRFINIFCGEPGGLDDNGVLRQSDLYRNASENLDKLFYGSKVLLGDSSYACHDWLVTPFECYENDDDPMPEVELQFNKLHSIGRAVVEESFGLLKTRFQRLEHFTEQTSISLVVNLAVCGCVLHNICIDNNDQIENKHIEDKIEGVETMPRTTDHHIKRQLIVEDLVNKNIIDLK